MWKGFILIILSYLIGCINTGYYYTKIVYKEDIRSIGTNVTGAVNVSRRAGKKGFLITFLGDAFKGILVVLLCRWLQINNTITMICILMVVIGHIFPIQLGFQGGKGISTAFGAFLAFNPMLIVCLIVICLVLLPFIRRFTVTSLIALLLLPVVLLITGSSWQMIIFFFLYALTINYASRSNLADFLGK